MPPVGLGVSTFGDVVFRYPAPVAELVRCELVFAEAGGLAVCRAEALLSLRDGPSVVLGDALGDSVELVRRDLRRPPLRLPRSYDDDDPKPSFI